MAILTVPTDSTLSSWSQRTILDGREYVLNFQWNQREAKWYLEIQDQAGDVVASGLKLVADFPINRVLTDSRAPAGTIIPVDTSGEGRDPGLTELGDRVVLVYVEASGV